MTDLVERVEQSILARRLIRRGETVLIAVSGGLDSTVLLQVLAELAKTQGWKLVVAHFNHRLRGRSSDADERLVRNAAKKLKLPFVSAAADVKAHARAEGISIEMAARKLRHEFLAKAAAKRKCRTIALAHHADDQVELFFLRLLRGAGSEGLAGMKWRSPSPVNRRIDLIRPLLDQTKTELRAFAKAARVVFREDVTNAQLDMQRNRIRHELIPLLTKHYQPALLRVVLREMEMLGAEAKLLKRAAADWLGEPLGRFEELPVALQRHCLQAQLPELGVAANFELIEQLRQSLNMPVMVNEATTIFRDESGKVHAQRSCIGDFDSDQKRVILEQSVEVNFGKTRINWSFERGDTGTFRADRRVANCEYFDAERVGPAIFLRHWRPGDRFQPLGMANPVKLQDLFVNQKIPRAERHGRVVAITTDGTIFWVEGLRMAERFKLDSGTTRRLKWRWQRL